MPIHVQKLIRACKSVGRRYPPTKPLKNTFTTREKERKFRTAYLRREKDKSERKISLSCALSSVSSPSFRDKRYRSSSLRIFSPVEFFLTGNVAEYHPVQGTSRAKFACTRIHAYVDRNLCAIARGCNCARAHPIDVANGLATLGYICI